MSERTADERLQAVRERRAEQRRIREELAEARRYGLIKRHANKLARNRAQR